MNEKNKDQEQGAAACGPGCSCGTSGSGGRGRWIVGVVVLLVAAALVARAMVKDNGTPVEDKSSAGFAVLSDPAQASTPDAEAKVAVTDALKEIASFAELNTVAMGSAGVFIYVPAQDESAAKSPIPVMRSAARTIEPQLRGKIGLFTLKAGSPDYQQLSQQMAVPGVLALVPGGRMVPLTGEITETKLVQGIVGSVQSCGAGGCGPSGCG
jgi:MYXO-CTERM domain-containing protein